MALNRVRTLWAVPRVAGHENRSVETGPHGLHRYSVRCHPPPRPNCTSVIVAAFVPGEVMGAAIAYLPAWLVMPEEKAHGFPDASHQLIRSVTNRKVAGVCGGFGEYFSVDPTVVRVLWAVLSICPGFVVGGVIAYVVAWFVMPEHRRNTSPSLTNSSR